MPSKKTEKSTAWFITVDGAYKRPHWPDLQQIFAVKHKGAKGDHIHWHAALILSSEIQQQAMLKRIKQIWDVSGAQLCAETWDLNEKVYVYMFHEEAPLRDDVVDNWKRPDHIVLTPEQIEDYRRRAQTANREYQEAQKKKKTKSKERIATALLNEVKDGIVERSEYMVFMRYMAKIALGEQPYPGPFRIKNVVHEVLLRSSNKEEFHRTANALYQDIFRS